MIATLRHRRAMTGLLVSVVATMPWTAGACGTTQSSAGPFVSNIHVQGKKLVVEECSLDYEMEDHRGLGAMVMVGVAILTFFTLFVEGDWQARSISTLECGVHVSDFPPGMRAADWSPPHCADSVERWRTAAAGTAAAGTVRERCVKQRVAISRRAFKVSDLKERTRLYQSMPDCGAPSRSVVKSAAPPEEVARLWLEIPEDCRRYTGATDPRSRP